MAWNDDIADVDRWPEISRTLRMEEAIDDLGVQVLYERGEEAFAHCPLPGHPGMDRNPSYSHNCERQVWNCFTCGDGGTVVKLVMRVLQVDYEAALEWLIQYSEYSSEDDGTFLKQIDGLLARDRPAWRSVNDKALPWYPLSKVQEWHELAMERKQAWFAGRRISIEVAQFLKLGFDPEHKKGKTGSYIGEAIIIPVMVEGQCVGWQERWLDDDRPDWVGKYTNTTDFPRESVLYNQAMLGTSRPLVVVESPMTTARLLSAGIPSVATFGAKVTDDQIELLARQEHLWISMDNDDAGLKATKRLVEALDDRSILEVIPPPPWAPKLDLGDLDDVQLGPQIDLRVPSILWATSHLNG